MQSSQDVAITVGPGCTVSASVHGSGRTVVVLGPGAGGSRRTPFLVRLAEAVAGSGRCALLYNFPYQDAKRRLPDPAPRLEATATAAAEFARQHLSAAKVVLGGKSMGGRIGSQAVAAGTRVDALVFLGYPLHPPGKPDRLRDRHLPQIQVPMLFVQGDRDAFAGWALLQALVARLGALAVLHPVPGGDHSFVVKRGTGSTTAEAETDIHRAVLAFLDRNGL